MRALPRALPLAIALALVALAGPAGAQPQAKAAPASSSPAADRAVVLDAFADLLRKDYLSQDAADAYAAHLSARARTAGDSDSDDAFANAVTDELQAIHPDAHLRLYAPHPTGVDVPLANAPKSLHAMPEPIGRSGWLDAGVAYIAFNVFFAKPDTLAQIRDFLDTHASAQVLVLDLRGHIGGELTEMDVLFPYLYAEPTCLLVMDARQAVEDAAGPSFPEGPTIRRIDGPEGTVRREHVALPGKATPLRDARVYVLTSRKTASAGEHLALALQRTHRATVVGDTTYGAGNFGDFFDLPAGYKAFVTTGGTLDPDTGLGWEGTGIAPDIAVPAKDALREVLRQIGRDPALAARFEPAA